MNLTIDLKNSHVIRSIDDFIAKYDAGQWLDNNIHLYDDLMHDTNGASVIIRDFFEQSKLIVNILDFNNTWIITAFKIEYAVVTNKKVIPVNNFDKAKELFCNMAKKRLKEERIYKEYPKEKIDYSVLKAMIEQLGINLKLIHE